jgi:hypothetical protein
MVTEVSNRDELMFTMVWEEMCLICSDWNTRERAQGCMCGFDDGSIRQGNGQGVQCFLCGDAQRIKSEEVPCRTGVQDGGT